MDVIVDSSAWIDFLSGRPAVEVDDAIADGVVVLSPLVIAELLSGELSPNERESVGELLQDFPMHDARLAHWMAVGKLRRLLAAKGLNVTIPDAHVAQCALDRDGVVYTRDEVFTRIAEHTSLRTSRLS